MVLLLVAKKNTSGLISILPLCVVLILPSCKNFNKKASVSSLALSYSLRNSITFLPAFTKSITSTNLPAIITSSGLPAIATATLISILSSLVCKCFHTVFKEVI